MVVLARVADHMQREYDIIIWGASGFTGKIVCDYMRENYSGGNLTWAIGGRNRSKLNALQAASGVDVLVADAHDPSALTELVKKTRVVLTTVGPYARYGSELVKACAEQGTHYCDLTGEVHWMRNMIERYDAAAKDSGAKIVHTCGFDSIPSDIGVFFMQQQMNNKHGVAASHIKYRTRAFKGGFSGGTIDSMMAMMESAKTDPKIMTTIADPYALNFSHRGLDGVDQNSQFYDSDFQAWVGPFVMAGINTRVVRRSHALAGMPYGVSFGYEEGTLIGEGPKGYLKALLAGFSTTLGTTLAAINPIRALFSRWLPKPGEGPARDKREAGFFEVILHGTAGSGGNQQSIKVKVTGDRDPGYGSTAKMIAEAAVCLAKDPLTGQGGVLTPSVAMGERLIERLIENAGLTFEVID